MSETAFPRQVAITRGDDPIEMKWEGGLTKREYFAGQAVIGYVTHWDVDDSVIPECAAQAVKFADCLIAELAKPVIPDPLLPALKKYGAKGFIHHASCSLTPDHKTCDCGASDLTTAYQEIDDE